MRKHQKLSLRVNELLISKIGIRNTIDSLKQRISLIEEAKDLFKHKIKELKRRIINLPSENPLDYTEYVEMRKGKNETDFGLFFEIAEGNKIIYNQVTINSLIKDMKKLKKQLF